jgi:hypothetical protein
MPQVMPPKDPQAVLDYTWNWATWLNGDTIATSDVSVVDSGITLASQANSTTAVTAWFSGGTAGRSYAVRNRITTAAGRTNDATIYITIEDR